MTKLDFSLPLHLPPVLSDTNVLNIYYKPVHDDEIRELIFVDKIVVPLRLAGGVYQTIVVVLPKERARRIDCRTIQFSISLN